MTVESVEVERPDRWDHPLSPEMSGMDLEWLLQRQPFQNMDAERFARTAPLEDILRNDSRVRQLETGDVIFREGQYGNSAYLVLDGSVRIFLTKLLPTGSSNKSTKERTGLSWLSLVRTSLRGNRRKREARKRPRNRGQVQPAPSADAEIGYRGEGSETRVFLQDVPGVLSQHSTTAVTTGELFGEMAAVTRSPREFTAIAETPCCVLEIRWQGLKLLKQDPAFHALLDQQYRSQRLKTHLRETMLFRFLSDESLEHIVEAAKFESFGKMEWYAEYKKRAGQPPGEQIAAEPLIAEEGSYTTGLWIIRGGFARLSRRQGAGHRTLSYLSKGQMFGLRELVQNYRQAQDGSAAPLPYQESLRAIGYVDAICIPKHVVNEHVLPAIRKADLPSPIVSPRYQFGLPVVDAPLDTAEHNVDTGLLEFLVDRRLMNGRQTMVIDTERCTRCDDCVKACAATHGGTPVFSREGPQYGPWLFAESCMHCEDPVCMIGCPTGAIHREHETGLVVINDQTCIGCKTCAESCPYENIRMVNAADQRGRAKVDQQTGLPILQASKCDLCSSGNGRPACQSACPHDALVRIDTSELSAISDLLATKEH